MGDGEREGRGTCCVEEWSAPQELSVEWCGWRKGRESVVNGETHKPLRLRMLRLYTTCCMVF